MIEKFYIKSILLVSVSLILLVSACSPSSPPTPSQQEVMETALSQIQAMNTANPDGHLQEIMKAQGVT